MLAAPGLSVGDRTRDRLRRVPGGVAGRPDPSSARRGRARAAGVPAPGPGGRPEQRLPASGTRSPGSRSTCRSPTWTAPFDYLVPTHAGRRRGAPAPGSGSGSPGSWSTRVVLDRVATSEHDGQAGLPSSGWSRPSRCWPPEVARLARAVADRVGAARWPTCCGSRVPPRHARVEAEPPRARPRRPAAGGAGRPAGARTRPARRSCARSAAAGRPGRSGRRCPARTGRPGSPRRPRPPSPAAGARSWSCRRRRDLDRLDAALTARLGAGPARRAVRRRSGRPSATGASWPPPRRASGWSSAPGPPRSPRSPTSAWWRSGTTATTCTPSRGRRTRTPARCCCTRAQLAGAAALVGGVRPDRRGAAAAATGWAQEIVADRRRVRAAAPRGGAAGDDPSWPATPAPRTRPAAQPGLADGAGRRWPAGAPVLVQVPRRGYVPAVACARLPHAGPLPALLRPAGRRRRRAPCRPAAGAAGRPPTTPARPAAAAGCGPSVVGAGGPPRSWAAPSRACRCAPPAATRCSPRCRREPALVVATPGAEPVAEGGYGAVLLLDTWALLTRADLRAGEETLRRWLTAAALARPGRRRRPGGRGRRRRWPAGAGAAALGSRLASPRASWPSGASSASRRPPGWRRSPAAPAAVAELLAAARLPRRPSVLGPVAGRRRRRSGCWCGCRAPAGAALARRCTRPPAVRSARKARATRSGSSSTRRAVLTGSGRPVGSIGSAGGRRAGRWPLRARECRAASNVDLSMKGDRVEVVIDAGGDTKDCPRWPRRGRRRGWTSHRPRHRRGRRGDPRRTVGPRGHGQPGAGPGGSILRAHAAGRRTGVVRSPGQPRTTTTRRLSVDAVAQQEHHRVTVQPIRLFGDPVLRTAADPVVDFDKELRTLVKDLIETMRDAGGAGLAAPQIGVGLRVFTFDVDDVVGHLVNPVLELPRRRGAGRPGGLPVHPRPLLSTPSGGRTSSPRASTSTATRSARRHRPDGPLRAARDRPPRRRAVPRPARPGRAQGGDEARSGPPSGTTRRRRWSRSARTRRHLRAGR